MEASENERDVLVVDDNAANVFVLSTMLQQMGYHVDEANSGVEAINCACHKNYAVIFMDHLMPDMDGIQTIQKIQFIMNGEECPRFIGVSATLDNEVIQAFSAIGVDEVIEKPVRQEVLVGILGELDATDTELSADSSGSIDSILGRVEGLNFNKGIDLMAGSTDNYVKVLEVCVKNIKDNYVALKNLEGTAQLDQFALHFHSLKGIFLNIGADTIAEESKALEFAAKEDRPEEIKEKFADYMKKVETFDDQLADAMAAYNQQMEQQYVGEKVSNSELEAELASLRQHIEDFEYIEITETLEKLLHTCPPETKKMLEKVSAAIADFDYDGALEALDA